MKKRIIVAAIAGIIAVSMIAGCAAGKNNTQSERVHNADTAVEYKSDTLSMAAGE